MTGFYVSVKDNGRTGLLVGPYPTHAAAASNVDGRDAVVELQPWAHFYAFGTAKVTHPNLPPGLQTERFGL